MTALTYRLAGPLAKTWSPGDEIMLRARPRRQRPAMGAGCSLGTGDGSVGAGGSADRRSARRPYVELVTSGTRLVAVAAASNLVGTIADVAAISDRPRRGGGWCISTGSPVSNTRVRTCRRSAQISSLSRHIDGAVGIRRPSWPPLTCWSRFTPTSSSRRGARTHGARHRGSGQRAGITTEPRGVSPFTVAFQGPPVTTIGG